MKGWLSSCVPFHCPVDALGGSPYVAPVKTTVDIDESLLREAEARARQQGKPLATVIEEALRSAIRAPQITTDPSVPPSELADLLDAHDQFFTALEEIRALGRSWVAKPAVELE